MTCHCKCPDPFDIAGAVFIVLFWLWVFGVLD